MSLWVYDIENLRCMFLFCAKNLSTGQRVSFEISKRKNQGDELIKWLQDTPIEALVGYNNCKYDMQCIQHFLDNHHKWHDLTVEEILNKTYHFSQNVIQDINGGLRPPYWEDDFSIRQIDLMKIHHFDNENKLVSLKWLEFMMDMENVEEMPWDHWLEELPDHAYEEIVDYCWNDIDATSRLYYYTIGEVENETYRGKNKIQDRLDMIETYGFPWRCMNWSDVKIGDEMNRKGYCELARIPEGKVYELKKQRGPTPPFTYGDCIPDYVQFQTPEFQAFLERMKGERVNLMEKIEYPFEYRGTRYMIAKGGIHSNEKNRIIIPGPNEILEDADVGSQYPNALRKRGLYPSQLGPKWNENFRANIISRLEDKAKGNDESLPEEARRKFKGLSEMKKLALNGGSFGKTNEPSSWQYDPFVQFSCTIGNQFEILMLVEMLELKGIHCVSANTDGIVCLYHKTLEQTYYDTCHQWEHIVGNTDLGKLEYTRFSALYQESVNHYVAVKAKDGKAKVKGRFIVEGELHKNNTDKIGRIERKAIVEYFHKGIPVEDTVRACRDIRMFYYGVKASWDYYYETIDPRSHQARQHKKLIRYFVSREGEKLYKCKHSHSEKKGAARQILAGGKTVTIFNKKIDKPFEQYGVDLQHYIEGAQRVIDEIERPGGKKVYRHKSQTTLF